MPSLNVPDLDASSCSASGKPITSSFRDESKDLFAEKKRAAWKDVQQAEARCDFASLISARLGSLLDIPFYEDIAEYHSKHRVGAVFTLGKQPPSERNIIVFDDFVTTGATMISMRELLLPLGYNLVFFTGINNKL